MPFVKLVELGESFIVQTTLSRSEVFDLFDRFMHKWRNDEISTEDQGLMESFIDYVNHNTESDVMERVNIEYEVYFD
jgi:hypothetical protein